MARIFISYKRVDKDKVFKIKDQIESELGEKCWIDLDGIESCLRFVSVVEKAIDAAEVFLFMYSSIHTEITDYDNDWTICELSYASRKHKRIVFINIDGSVFTDYFVTNCELRQHVDGMSPVAIISLIHNLGVWKHKESIKSIDVKTSWDGSGFELEGVELNQITNRDLIQQMIDAGAIPPETYLYGDCHYALIDNNGVIVFPGETETLAELGFHYGDTIRITKRGSGGGGGTRIDIRNGHNDIPLIANFEPTIWSSNCKLRISEIQSFWLHFFARRDKIQNVNAYSSVFAPSEVKRKQHMMVQVYLHLAEETEKVKSLAVEADRSAERKGYEPLEVKLKKGDKITVELNINGDTLLYNDRKSVVWQGSFVKRAFDYIVPDDIDVNELSCSVNIFVNGAIAGEMIFLTDIVDYNPRQLNTEIIAKPTKKLFISYSHKDIKSAEKIAKIHEALGIDVFFDKHRLKAGYIYSEEISKFIQTADTFVLCWSKNASESDYVEKERQEALSLAYPQRKPREHARLRIHPYNIEPHAVPPADMIENYHFEEL